IAEAVAVQRRRDLQGPEIPDLGLDAVAQLLRRHREAAVEEALGIDLELPDVPGHLIQGLAEGRSETGGRRRGEPRSSRRFSWRSGRTRALAGSLGDLRQLDRSRSGARGSLGVHESPMIPSTGTGRPDASAHLRRASVISGSPDPTHYTGEIRRGSKRR